MSKLLCKRMKVGRSTNYNRYKMTPTCQTTHSALTEEGWSVWSVPLLAHGDEAWRIHFLQAQSNSRLSPAHKHNFYTLSKKVAYETWELFSAVKYPYMWASIFILWLLLLLLFSLGLASSRRISFILILIRFLHLTHIHYIRSHDKFNLHIRPLYILHTRSP